MAQYDIELSGAEIEIIIDALDSYAFAEGLSSDCADVKRQDTIAELRAIFTSL